MLHRPAEIHVFTRAGVRALDQAATEELGIPGIILMENAAVSLAQAALDLIASRGLSRIAIACGPGNNGGDGFALARHLANRGFNPLIIATVPIDRLQGDAGVNARIAERMELRIIDPILAMAPQAALEIVLDDGPIAPTDEEARRILIVDALLGTGADRPVAPPLDRLVQWMNGMRRRGSTILAVDIPTGLDADTGLPLGGPCVHADVTLTLAGIKKGFLHPDARRHTGEVIVGDIGVPMSLLRKHATAV